MIIIVLFLNSCLTIQTPDCDMEELDHLDLGTMYCTSEVPYVEIVEAGKKWYS